MKYFTMPSKNEGTMSLRNFLDDPSGRVILAAAGLFVLAGAVGANLSPSLLAYPVLAAASSLAATLGAVGLIRAIYVAPGWALASIFTGSYLLPVLYFFELMTIKNSWPAQYVSFPVAAILLLVSVTGTRLLPPAYRPVPVRGRDADLAA